MKTARKPHARPLRRALTSLIAWRLLGWLPTPLWDRLPDGVVGWWIARYALYARKTRP